MIDEVREVLERALASPTGIRVTMKGDTHEAAIKAAIRLRWQCNSLRKADREATLAMFPPGDERRGRSQFDGLELRLEGATIVIEPRRPPPILDISEIAEKS